MLQAVHVCGNLLRGSSPNNFAKRNPSEPPGGLYCSETFTSVPEPSAAGVKCTDPALSTSAPSSDRQPINLFSISLMISAFHSTRTAARSLGDPVRMLIVHFLNGLQMVHETR